MVQTSNSNYIFMDINNEILLWLFGEQQMVIAAMKLKDAYSWKESDDQPR